MGAALKKFYHSTPFDKFKNLPGGYEPLTFLDGPQYRRSQIWGAAIYLSILFAAKKGLTSTTLYQYYIKDEHHDFDGELVLKSHEKKITKYLEKKGCKEEYLQMQD